MLGFLFRTLTAEPHRGAALFDAAIQEARHPHWFVEGKVPDTIDGRFAVLATVTALILVRLEQSGEDANPASVALTERFVEVMESEHREMGVGDPTLGKTVRKLVGSLSRRTDLWRAAVAGERDWTEASHESLYKGGASPDALMHSAEALRKWWEKLAETPLEKLAEANFS